MKKEMEGEIINLAKVWISVMVSLSYCYVIGKFLHKGIQRLLAVLPIVCFFLVLPLNVSSIHLGGLTAFSITWIANFKLLVFAFGKGPLCSDPSVSLTRFVAVACLPIKIQLSQKKESSQKLKKGNKSLLNYAIKALLLALFIQLYDYSDYIHPKFILVLYSAQLYCFLEIMLAMAAYLAGAILGLELEPQFDEPYLSTSLQDFWGRRWNLMVTRILRPTVYEPVLDLSSRVVGRKLATFPAIFGTFLASGLMHELIFYYLGRVRPTWEITCFFLLHGLCFMVEIALKKALPGKFQLHGMISRPLTVGFVITTGIWLFFPPLLRCKAYDRAFKEYEAIAEFMKDIGRAFTVHLLNGLSSHKSPLDCDI